MRALILAGGLGTRLRPLTHTRPKHLLPVANRAHIEHVFVLLQRHGIDEAVLLTSYLPEAFDGALRSGKARGMDLEVVREPRPLGTAGALRNAARLIGDGTFLALNGDILTDVDLGAVTEWHGARRAEATLVLTRVEDPSPFGVVLTDASGRVLQFVEKPPRDDARTDLVNAGVYVLEPAVLEAVPDGEVWSAERQLFPQLVAGGGRLYGFVTDAYWIDIGTPANLVAANLDALAGRYVTEAVASPRADGVIADEDVRVAPGASVSSTCLGRGAVLQKGAIVEGSVLLPRALVGEDAIVVASVLGEGARIEAGARVRGLAVADGEVVAAG